MSPRFDTTRWSLVQAAGDSQHHDNRQALERLCEIYWPAVYAFVRSGGQDAESARDLTQGFFTQLLSRHALRVADPERGRFRSFLLAGVRNFVTNEWRKEQRRKRGGETTVLSLDFDLADSALDRALVDRRTPEDEFDRQWALSVLNETLRRLEEEMRGRGNDDQFRLLAPLLSSSGRGDYAALGATSGLSEGALRVALHRMRRRFGAILRDEVAQTLADARFLDEEIAHLRRTLAGDRGPLRGR